jgi:RNase P subunit RPR2
MTQRIYKRELDDPVLCPICKQPAPKLNRSLVHSRTETYVSTYFACTKCGIKIRVQIPYYLATIAEPSY